MERDSGRATCRVAEKSGGASVREKAFDEFPVRKDVPLNDAIEVFNSICDFLVIRPFENGPTSIRAFAVGSIRRKEEAVKDIDILVVVPDVSGDDRCCASIGKNDVCLLKNRTFKIVSRYASGERWHSLIIERRRRGRKPEYYHVDVFCAHESEKPFALFHYTGSRDYNIRTRAHAKRQGYLLNQYGLFYSDSGRRVRGSSSIKTERDLAKKIGVSFKRPENRV